MKNQLLSPRPLTMLVCVGFIIKAQTCLAIDPASTTLPTTLSSDLRETTSLIAELFKVMGSLAVVVGIMLLLFFLFKKSAFNKGLSAAGSLINVVESRMIAPKKYIAVVEIANKYVAVGITDNSITLLTDLESSVLHNANRSGQKSAASPFSGMLKKATRAIQKRPQSADSRGEEATDA
nr:flagellar biosynthetic protein FliO [Desulfobulbaceae bacterium]